MKYIHFIKRVFKEIYNFQVENWGSGNLPALTALLYLSILQFINILAIMGYLYAAFNFNLIDFFGTHYYIGLIIPLTLLLSDYLIIKPINITLQEELPKNKITWIYILASLLFLTGCLIWIYNIN